MAKKNELARDEVIARLSDMTEAQVVKVAIEAHAAYRDHESKGALAALRLGAALNDMGQRLKVDGRSFNDWLDRNSSKIGVDRRRAFKFMSFATQVEKNSVPRAALENT